MAGHLADGLSDWEVVEAYHAHMCGTGMKPIARRYRVSVRTMRRAFRRLEGMARDRGLAVRRGRERS